MNSPPSGPLDMLTVPSLSRDFDSGPADLRSGLAWVSLEQAAEQRVETRRHGARVPAGGYERSYKLRE